jgi:hypothetical protein
LSHRMPTAVACKHSTGEASMMFIKKMISQLYNQNHIHKQQHGPTI